MGQPNTEKITAIVSPKGKLLYQDIVSLLKTGALFLIPVALIYFTAVQTAIADGFTWADFIPNQITQGSIATWFLSQILAILRKYGTERIYETGD